MGWATPPFGIDAIEQSQIRIIARANDIPKIRDKTVHVMIAQADTLQKRRDVLARFVQGYRDTIEWMYSNPAALAAYADFAGVSGSLARRLRDEFYTKEMVSPDNIRGLDGCQRGEVRTVVEEATGRPRSNGPAASSHRQALRMATGFSRPDRRDCQPPRPTSSFRIWLTSNGLRPRTTNSGAATSSTSRGNDGVQRTHSSAGVSWHCWLPGARQRHRRLIQLPFK